MSNGEDDYDRLQSFFPGWREEDQSQGNRNNGGRDQNHQHPAPADAAQMAQAAHAAYVRYHQSQSPQARTIQMNQQGQPPGQYSQGIYQTLFRSQLHRHTAYEQSPQQQTQQQSLRLPQIQPYNQVQHRVDHQACQQAEQQRREHEARQQAEQVRQTAEQQARQQSQTYDPYGTQHQSLRQPPQDPRDQLQQCYREAQNQHQMQAQPVPRPQQDSTQSSQQYQYRDSPHQQQYVQPSDINPSVSYYQPNSSRSYASLAPVRSPMQESASAPATGEIQQRSIASPKSHPSGQQSPSLAPQTTVSAPSVQRNSTPTNTQQNVPETCPKTPPLAPGQSQSSSKEMQGQRRESFLEDTAISSSTSPQKDPYTSSSRSTLGPRATAAKASTAAATASASDKATKRPSVSHSHPSPKSVTSTAVPVSASVPTSAPMSVPAHPHASSSPPVRNSTPAAVAVDLLSMGASTTSASSRSPPALRAYETPQMQRAYTHSQPVIVSAPPQPADQPAAQIIRSTSAPSVPPATSRPAASAVPPPKASVPPQVTAEMARSTSATSVPLDNFTPFAQASSTPTTSVSSGPVTTRPTAAPSASGNGRNSPLPSQAQLPGGGERRGRPPKYPNIVGPINQSAVVGQLVDGRTMHSHPNPPPGGRPFQYQPAPSGLPTLPTTATGRASAPPQAWRPPSNTAHQESRSVSRPNNRPHPKFAQFPPPPRAPSSQIQAPTSVYRPGNMNTPPNLARTVARPPGQNAAGSLQSRPGLTQPPAAKRRRLDDSAQYAVTPPSKALDLTQYIRHSENRKHITYRSDIVEPVKISDVLVKTKYDPATIARDILIAADKHPSEKGLNHHLRTVRQNFLAVGYSSDMTTFKWDLVDPWVHYPPGYEAALAKAQEAMARAQQVPTTSASELVPAGSPIKLPLRSPNLPLNSPGVPHVSARDDPTAPLPRPVEGGFGYKHNSSTAVTTGAGTTGLTQASPVLISSSPTGPGVVVPGPVNSSTFGPGTRTGTTNPNLTPSYQAHPATVTSTFSPAPEPKPAHRPIPTPPAAVDLNAFAALPFKFPAYYSPLRPNTQPLPDSLPSLPSLPSSQKVHPSVSSPVPTPPPQSSPRKSVEPVTVASSSSKPTSPRPVPREPKAPSQSPRGKVPRQPLLLKGLPEPHVVIPVSPGTMAPPKKKITRPPQRDVQVEVAIDNRPTPEYQVFRCKWIGCQAELHNLQATQSHIVGVHIPHHIVCGWAGCTDKKARPASEMWDHVQLHIKRLAWQLGDGPSVSVTAAGDYESPEMSTQDRNGTVTLPADRDSVKIFSRIHGTQSGKQKAQVMDDGGRQWKEGGGPDTDVSDRAISTPPRLMTSSHSDTAYTMSDVQVVI